MSEYDESPESQGYTEMICKVDKLGPLLVEAVSRDGGHHKQWYLERIAELFEIPLPEHEEGIP